MPMPTPPNYRPSLTNEKCRNCAHTEYNEDDIDEYGNGCYWNVKCLKFNLWFDVCCGESDPEANYICDCYQEQD